ncbi:hypothetical protein MPSEU_000692500 [Mayamaea pseudoterrestris]|nr:hypothetical protein MPSEU_000692500 [Mayamaea pseudoterrestris]
MATSNRKQQLDYQQRMNQSTSSFGNVNAASKTPTKLRSSFSSVKTRGASALKSVLSSKKDAPSSPTVVSVSESSVEVEARSDAPSTRLQSLTNKQQLGNGNALTKAARRMSAPSNVTNKQPSAAAAAKSKKTSEDESKMKKQRRATINAATATMQAAKSAAKVGTRLSRRASTGAAATVDLTEFVQLDKTKRRETLAILDPQQVEHLFVESSRKLLAKKTSLQKQLDELQEQHVSETRRLQEQLVDANMRLKQRELVHAQRQANQSSSLQQEHQRLHQEMVAAQCNFDKQASELEIKSLTLMEQIAEMKYMIEHVQEYEDQADEATYMSFQLMMLLAVGVAAVWVPVACAAAGGDTGLLPSLATSLPSLWTFGG